MNTDILSHGLERLGAFARGGLAALSHRGELATLEAAQARDHLAGSFAFALAASAMAVLGGFALNFALAASLWHRPDRAWLLALLALLQLMASAALAFWTFHRLRRWRPLGESLRQLREDRELLETLLPGHDPSPARPATFSGASESPPPVAPTARGPLA